MKCTRKKSSFSLKQGLTGLPLLVASLKRDIICWHRRPVVIQKASGKDLKKEQFQSDYVYPFNIFFLTLVAIHKIEIASFSYAALPTKCKGTGLSIGRLQSQNRECAIQSWLRDEFPLKGFSKKAFLIQVSSCSWGANLCCTVQK